MSSLYVVCDTDLVSVVMNVIRMIKLFGWEGRMSSQIDGKRSEELDYIRKLRFMELANSIL